METKHTQGEWALSSDTLNAINDEIKIFHAGSGEEIAALRMKDSFKSPYEKIETSEQKANAKLIAAAPDLLKEGIETRDLLWEHFQQLPQALKNKLNDWRAAIKKATE